jgi:hypothetical protein
MDIVAAGRAELAFDGAELAFNGLAFATPEVDPSLVCAFSVES